MNAPGVSPGYGQSILHDEQLVFDSYFYNSLTKCPFGSTTDKDQFDLSSGYVKSTSPAIDMSSSRGNSNSMHKLCEAARTIGKLILPVGGLNGVSDTDTTVKRKFNSTGMTRLVGSSSLGRQNKENLPVPSGECMTSPGSLSDLRSDYASNESSRMQSSLSLQVSLILNFFC